MCSTAAGQARLVRVTIISPSSQHAIARQKPTSLHCNMLQMLQWMCSAAACDKPGWFTSKPSNLAYNVRFHMQRVHLLVHHCNTAALQQVGSQVGNNHLTWLATLSCNGSECRAAYAALYCSRLQAAPTLQPSHMACIMQWLCMQVQSQNSTLTTAKKPS